MSSSSYSSPVRSPGSSRLPLSGAGVGGGVSRLRSSSMKKPPRRAVADYLASSAASSHHASTSSTVLLSEASRILRTCWLLMETEGGSFVTVRKTSTTPKAIIHQKFGVNACYTIEEVHESADNGCPGLAIVQKDPCLYRCTLQLPEITVVSKICKKNKDAEQSAAEVALEKLRIDPATKSSSLPETWDGLVSRVKHIFSDEFFHLFIHRVVI